jgi:hypothetical protein
MSSTVMAHLGEPPFYLELFPHNHVIDELLAKTLHEGSGKMSIAQRSSLLLHITFFSFRAIYDSDAAFVRNNSRSWKITTS